MKIFDRLVGNKKKVVLVLAVVVSLGAASAVASAPKAHAACAGDTNSILFCGTTGASDFIHQVQTNDDGNGHHDLQNIYAAYNLVPAEYQRFVASAQPGTAYKDGHVVVGNQTVIAAGTSTTSIGRIAARQGSGYFTKTINNVNYYGNTNQQAFAHDSLPVLVMFNAQGVAQFAVLTNCGNPLSGPPVTPHYTCDMIHKQAVQGQPNTYNFTANATGSNNATILHFTYNFGDGTPEVTETSGSTPVPHTYQTPGNYTATVTVTFALPGNQQVTATSQPCAIPIVVASPFYSCVSLTSDVLDQNKFSYSFRATANVGNGATFTGADFNFGDNSTQNGVQPNGNVVTANHQYAQAGNYTTTATLHFNSSGQAKTVTCTVPISSTSQPCQYNQNLAATDTNCVKPASTLVNTGAGSVLTIFGAVVVAGIIFFRQYVLRHRSPAGVSSDTAALGLGHTALGSQDEDHSHEMVQHLTQADKKPAHRNASNALHHPRYQRSNRFRPDSKK